MRLALPDDQAQTPGVSFRTRIAGPEKELIDAALCCRLPTDGRLARVVFHEPSVPTGYPDVVAVYPTSRSVAVSPERLNVTAAHIRLLHQIHCLGYTRAVNLSQLVHRRLREVLKMLDVLERAGLIVVRGNAIRLQALERIFVAKRIVAIEAKVRDWRKALQQAAANRWFASHSYVLLPLRRSYRLVLEEATALGVGVLAYRGSRLDVLLKASVQPIPQSFGSWLFNEWVIGHRYTAGGIHGCH